MVVLSGRPQAAGAQAGTAQAKPTRVERGQYLATIGNCVSCHTVQGRPAFSGGREFTTPFGSIYSTNITPDKKSGIGRWSEQQFERAMRMGERADGAHLYPVFPFPSFTRISDEDIAALWAYFRTVPPAENTPPANRLKFPFNQRWLMGLWKSLFFSQGRFSSDPTKSVEWNRGAYLVQGLAHCGACHTPRNSLGAEKESEYLSGGTHLDKVPSGEIRKWSAVNLTSSPNGLKAWSLNDIQMYLKYGHNSRAGPFGPMHEVIEQSTRHFTNADILSIATYLRSLPALGTATTKPTPQEMAAGENSYAVHCGTCHLPTGAGGQDTGPPLAGSAVVLAEDPASLINIILYGASVAQNTGGTRKWKDMEPFGDQLSDREIADLCNFLRGSWGNAAPAVDTSEVTAQR
jgi:mono/diheme cytochrome c family protein